MCWSPECEWERDRIISNNGNTKKALSEAIQKNSFLLMNVQNRY